MRIARGVTELIGIAPIAVDLGNGANLAIQIGHEHGVLVATAPVTDVDSEPASLFSC